MLTELTLIGLAAWRLALFLVDDAGPFEVASKLRRFIRAERPLQRTVEPDGALMTSWEKLWSCMRCMTFWTGLGLYGVWQLEDRVVLVLAVWGLAQVVEFIRNGG